MSVDLDPVIGIHAIESFENRHRNTIAAMADYALVGAAEAALYGGAAATVNGLNLYADMHIQPNPYDLDVALSMREARRLIALAKQRGLEPSFFESYDPVDDTKISLWLEIAGESAILPLTGHAGPIPSWMGLSHILGYENDSQVRQAAIEVRDGIKTLPAERVVHGKAHTGRVKDAVGVIGGYAYAKHVGDKRADEAWFRDAVVEAATSLNARPRHMVRYTTRDWVVELLRTGFNHPLYKDLPELKHLELGKAISQDPDITF